MSVVVDGVVVGDLPETQTFLCEMCWAHKAGEGGFGDSLMDVFLSRGGCPASAGHLPVTAKVTGGILGDYHGWSV